MIPVILGCALGVAGLFAWAVRGPFRVFHTELVGALEGLAMALRGGEETHRRLMELEEAVDRLPAKWEDVKREANSFYSRGLHHVRRVREELEARGLRDTELDDLDGQLRPLDEPGGDGEGVPPVQGDMGSAVEGTAGSQLPFWLQTPAIQAMIRRSRGEG